MTLDLTRYTPKRTPAGKFFDSKQFSKFQEINSPNELIDYLRTSLAPDGEQRNHKVLPKRSVYFRGQANYDYGLTSFLYRVCRETIGSRKITEHLISKAEQGILVAMKQEGLGRGMSDMELLQVLQHHGIPTRLIDVSTHPLEALFFAVDRDDSIPGRFFIIRLDAMEEGGQILKRDCSDALPWADMARGSDYASSDWTKVVALIDADPLDPRMRAQRGKFLVGGA